MFWTFVIAFATSTSLITCENVNLTNAKWKYDTDTAELLQTELDIKSSTFHKHNFRFDMTYN